MNPGMVTCILLAALSQQPPQGPSQPAAQAAKPATVAGRIVNATTGAPIRRVSVTLRPFGAPGGAGFVGEAMPAAPYAATTDAEGKFRIEQVEPGSYRLMAERQGFVRQQYGARRNSMMGMTVKVAAGQELTDLNFKLTPHAVITGRVLDEEGEPLARAQVQVMRRGYFRGKQQMMPVSMGQSIDTGEFRLADLPPGRYWIAASYRGQMAFGGSPARNTTGKPEEEYVTTYYPGSVDATGARPVDVDAGQQLPGIDIRMQKARVYRVRGRVTGASPSVRTLRVMLLPRERAFSFGMFSGAGGAVKEDGTFEIGSVQPGSYYATAFAAQGRMSTVGRAPVDVAQDDVQDLILPLTGGVNLQGSIRADRDATQPEPPEAAKTTFESVRLQVVPTDGIAFNAPNATVKSDGSFVIENIGPGKYRIQAFNLPAGHWLKSVRAGGQEVLDSGIEIGEGPPGPIQITLGIGVGVVSGTVQDADQHPAAGAMVTLLPDPMKEDRTDLSRVATTDQNGQFTLQNVPPGDYRLYAWEDIDSFSYSDPEFLKPHESAARKLTVKANSQEQVTLKQIPAKYGGL